MFRSQVLVAVDDDPIVLKLMEIVAGQIGYEFHGVLSGEECLTILETVTPGILVLDIEMPGLSGFETYEEIKAAHPGSHYPIIFLSAKKDATSIKTAGNLGSDYFRKPILIVRVVEKIKAIMQIDGAPVMA